MKNDDTKDMFDKVFYVFLVLVAWVDIAIGCRVIMMTDMSASNAGSP